VFVHGCFWHRHTCPAGKQLPKSRRHFWQSKLQRNAQRDRKVQERLRDIGWGTLVIWSCQLDSETPVAARLQAFLGSPRSNTRRRQPKRVA
jgi:DNA mismatch endonuclease (patch repair protein)